MTVFATSAGDGFAPTREAAVGPKSSQIFTFTFFGPAKAVPDIASVGARDGTTLIHQAVAALGSNADGIKYVEFMKGKKLNSPRGPMMIDPEERDVIHNIYIRRVEKRDDKLMNVDIGQVDMVKDPWKIDNPPKAN